MTNPPRQSEAELGQAATPGEHVEPHVRARGVVVVEARQRVLITAVEPLADVARHGLVQHEGLEDLRADPVGEPRHDCEYAAPRNLVRREHLPGDRELSDRHIAAHRRIRCRPAPPLEGFFSSFFYP